MIKAMINVELEIFHIQDLSPKRCSCNWQRKGIIYRLILSETNKLKESFYNKLIYI